MVAVDSAVEADDQPLIGTYLWKRDSDTGERGPVASPGRAARVCRLFASGSSFRMRKAKSFTSGRLDRDGQHGLWIHLLAARLRSGPTRAWLALSVLMGFPSCSAARRPNTSRFITTSQRLGRSDHVSAMGRTCQRPDPDGAFGQGMTITLTAKLRSSSLAGRRWQEHDR